MPSATFGRHAGAGIRGASPFRAGKITSCILKAWLLVRVQGAEGDMIPLLVGGNPPGDLIHSADIGL